VKSAAFHAKRRFSSKAATYESAAVRLDGQEVCLPLASFAKVACDLDVLKGGTAGLEKLRM
jgi:hypothetical protein